MKKFQPATGRQGRFLAGRRAWALVAGMTLLLTSGFSVEAHAASRPATNHLMEFLPTSPKGEPLKFKGRWSAQAGLYNRNGKEVNHWGKWSIKGDEKITWRFYSEDPKAWLHIWVRIEGGATYSFLTQKAVCDHFISFSDIGKNHDVLSCD